MMSHLELKGEKFTVFTGASEQDISSMDEELKRIDDRLHTTTTRAAMNKMPKAKEFFDKHCQIRHYSFCITKCKDSACPYHNEPRLPPQLFAKLHPLPDPILAQDVSHYKTFHEVYGTPTTDVHRPSLKSQQKISHEVPFSPSAASACRVRRVVQCDECDKPRVIHSSRKLT